MIASSLSNNNPDTNEKLLLKQIAEGDEQAFEVLFYQYLPVLKQFSLKFTRSEHIAEEIIQDTFLRIWLNREKLEGIENIKSYLYKYASNECLNYLRKELKKAKAIDQFALNCPENRNTTLDTLNLNEINQLIGKAVECLPNQRKKIFKMSRNDGMTIPDIAGKLQVSPNTVKNALVISLKSVREYLHQHGITLSVLTYITLLK